MTTTALAPTKDRLAIESAELEWVPVDGFSTDPSYNREPNEGRINALAEKWDDDAIGVIYASRRNKTLVLLDGQHRIAALRKQGRKKERVPTLIFDGLTIEHEARLFVLMNKNRRALTPSELFRASLVEGDPAAKEIQTVLDGMDLSFNSVASDNDTKTLKAVATVQRIYRATGVAGLDATLSLILMTWGDPPPRRAFHQYLLLGVARVLYYGENRLDIDRLRITLMDESPDALVSRCDSIRSLSGGQLDRLIATDITERYNRGLPVSKRIDGEIIRSNKDPFKGAAKFQRKAS